MFKTFIKIILSFAVIAILVSCGKQTSQSNQNEIKNNTETNQHQIDIDSDSKILIAYFSWSGHTKELAQEIQSQVGGDLFEIQTKEPYTTDINVLSSQSLQEQRDNIRPALSTHVDNMDQYDMIFIGYPNWWSNMPMPVFTFLEEYDFSGKTIIPFTTYGESGFGNSLSSIHEILKDSTIVKGLAIQEHEMEDLSNKVKDWLQTLTEDTSDK